MIKRSRVSSSRSGFFSSSPESENQFLLISECVHSGSHMCAHTDTQSQTDICPPSHKDTDKRTDMRRHVHSHAQTQTYFLYVHRHRIISFKRIRFMCMYGFLCAHVSACLCRYTPPSCLGPPKTICNYSDDFVAYS